MNRSIVILALALLSCSGATDIHRNGTESSAGTAPGIHDAHVHIMSPQLISLWKGMGIPFSKEDHYYSSIDTIMEALGPGTISLVSMAYVYSSNEFGGRPDDIIGKVRAENDYLAHARSRYPGRIKAFYGIDPLRDDALEEIRRCHEELRLDGIKLHHNASQVYLTVPEHLRKVREVFRYASENSIPILMHFDNSHRKFGRRDVGLLADSVLHGLAFVDLQIAHFGTSGGFNSRTAEVLDAFIELFASDHPAAGMNITFDISSVCLDKDADGVPRLSDEEFVSLGQYCRKLGFNRIVFGTDYPLYRSAEYLRVLRSKLLLTESETKELLRRKR